MHDEVDAELEIQRERGVEMRQAALWRVCAIALSPPTATAIACSLMHQVRVAASLLHRSLTGIGHQRCS
jgi:hypothetical protein